MKAWFEDWFDSPYYHLLYSHRNEKEAEDFLAILLLHLKPAPEASFLDLACGRGRHSLFLRKRGFRVTGVDLSESNIRHAGKDADPKLSFLVHDMRHPIQGKYDYILNLFTSFGYFEDEENRQVLHNIRLALQLNGTFVLDFLNNRVIAKELPQRETVRRDKVLFETHKYIEGKRIFKEIKVTAPSRSVIFVESVANYSLEDLKKMMEMEGLAISGIWGSYKAEKFDPETSPRLILFCSCIQ